MKKSSKIIIVGLVLTFIYGAGRTVQNELLNLEYFDRSEFGIWWPLMDADVLLKLDAFRREWGNPVVVSSHKDALGREDENSGSMHNVLKWGKVRAVDVFPRGMNSYIDRRRAYQIAKKVGFTGIGVYTDTTPSNMLHLDNRPQPLEWTRINGVYNYGVIA